MTEIRRRDGRPVWLEAGVAAQGLARVDFGSTAASGYDEAWLQDLLHTQPGVFPIDQIEPGFGDLIPLCRELPLMFGAGKSGALDNIFVTSEGGIALVEAKLWRNPQARREVVAQAMEYAGAVFRMSYDELEQNVRKARVSEGVADLSLFGLASAREPSLDEAQFVDAVSRNLRRGRAVIAVVGDGIREDITPMAELLQSHAGQRFTFALVELAVFESPSGNVRIVVPSVLARTVLIERGVVRIESDNGQVRVDPIRSDRASTNRSTSTHSRAVSIGEDEFYEIMGQRDPGAPQLLRDFLERADQLGVFVDRQAGLNLKHIGAGGRALNLGTIRKDGFVDTGPASWWGRTQEGKDYNGVLAGAIGGVVVDVQKGEQNALRTLTGKTPRLSDLLPDHADSWLAAMESYILAVVAREGGDSV